ncbi:unnamed protein product [Agarophyton chilense]
MSSKDRPRTRSQTGAPEPSQPSRIPVHSRSHTGGSTGVPRGKASRPSVSDSTPPASGAGPASAAAQILSPARDVTLHPIFAAVEEQLRCMREAQVILAEQFDSIPKKVNGTATQDFSEDLCVLRADMNSILESLGGPSAFVKDVAEKFSRVRSRLETLEQSLMSGNNPTEPVAVSYKGRKEENRQARKKQRNTDPEPSDSSSSESDSSDSSVEVARCERSSRSKRSTATHGVICARTKERKHIGLKELKPTNSLFKILLSYRYYRLEDSSLDSTPRDPILVLHFLARFVAEADILGMNEGQAYIALPYLLRGLAEDQYHSVRGTSRASEGGVTCWPEAVQYLLSSNATNPAIQQAIRGLRDTRQRPDESGTDYSTLLNKAFHRFGNVYPAEERCTMFIDGLDPAIRIIAARRREDRPKATYLELEEFVGAEGEALRARTPGSRVRSSKALMLQPGTPSALIIEEQASRRDYDNVQLAHIDLHSIPTTKLPSTLDESQYVIEDDTLLYADNGRVRAPRVPHESGNVRFSRAGWRDTRPVVMFAEPRHPTPASGLICHLCYKTGHTSPQCVLSLREWAQVVINYEALSQENKAVVPNASYIRSQKDVPHHVLHPRALVVPAPESRVTDVVSHPTASAEPSGPDALALPAQRPEQPPPAEQAQKNLMWESPLKEGRPQSRGRWRPRRPSLTLRSKPFQGKRPVLVMAKRNYKVYADLGLSPQFMSRICRDHVPEVTDANNKPLDTVGFIELVVRVGARVVKLDFIVCQKSSAPVILGCDFCDRFVEAIFPRQRRVEMEDGSYTPIVCRPLRRATKKHVPLTAAQEPGPNNRESNKLHVAASLCVSPESQMMVNVTSRKHGLRVLQPLSSLYDRHSLAIANGFVHVEPNQPFHVLIANLVNVPQYLVKNQVIRYVMPHPIAIVPTKLTAADVLGLVHTKEGDSPEPVSSPVSGVQPVSSGMQPVSTSGDRPDPVQELEELDLSHVPESYRHRLRELLRDFTTM